jgi:drug/metabolite transporter (DMT)-like permease
LVVQGAEWSFTGGGVTWSLVAGVVGAVGAFSVLLAFGAKGTPAVVMSLVFAGAPIVNALVSVAMHNLWSQIRWPFLLGIVMAAVGAYLVVSFKPAPTSHAAKPGSTAPIGVS